MKKQARTESGLVYSTEHGKMCPNCHRPIARCICSQSTSAPPRDGIVRVGRETKGRKGKGVTLVTAVPLAPAELAELCTRLKKRCGSGGAVKDGVIEIQGEHRDTVIEELSKYGWPIKRAGA